MNETKSNTDPMELLRKHWQNLDINAAGLDDANRAISQRLAHGSVSTTQDKICRRLTRNSIIGLLLFPLALMMFHMQEIPGWVCIVYALFGLIMASLNGLLSRYVRRERLVDLPVAQAYARALDIRLKHNQLRLFGIVVGVFVIVPLLLAIFDTGSRAMMWGAVTGLVIGLAIAVIKCINENRLYRSLVESLQE